MASDKDQNAPSLDGGLEEFRDTMTTAVIGATGRIGSEIVRGVLARGDAVGALVRDPGKARRAFGEPGGLHIRPTRLDDPRDLTEALDGVAAVFITPDWNGLLALK